MSSNKSFPLDYVNLTNYDRDSTSSSRDAQALTLLGASAMSALCYEDRSKVVGILRNDAKFDLVRSHDVVSHLFPLGGNSGKPAGEQSAPLSQAPLMAWSNRLQLIFLAFPGTHVAKDILTDMDIRQVADSERASRFHHGFYSRASIHVPLVEHLARGYRVVLCGHSLGGAMATILAYLTLTRSEGNLVRNTWEEGGRFSVITFGTPSPMVVEKPDSTAYLNIDFTKNFHHVMHQDDPIPFLLNHSRGWIDRIMAKVYEAATVMLGGRVYMDILMKIIRVWKGSSDNFAHYGRLYILEVHGSGSGRSVECVPVTHARHITPSSEISGEIRFHGIDHYNECIRKVTYGKGVEKLTISGGEELGSLRQFCLPLPDPIRNGVCGIGDDKILVSVKLNAPLAGYFISRVTFKQGNEEIEPTAFGYELQSYESEVTLSIIQGAGQDEGAGKLLKATDALQNSLTIHDAFGYKIRVLINRMENPSLNNLTMLPMYKGIRQAMIIAFADQMSRVHKLRMSRDGSEQPIELTEKAQSIARVIDQLVGSATPVSIKVNFERSFQITKSLWDSDQNESIDIADLVSTVPLGNSALNPMSLLPKDCDDALRELLSSVFSSIKDSSLWLSTTIRDLNPNLISFEQALRDFSQQLFDRPEETDERIRLAIDQGSKLLAVMHFSHVMILSVTSPQESWLFDTSGEIVNISMSAVGTPILLLPHLLGSGLGVPFAVAAFACGYFNLGYLLYRQKRISSQQVDSDYERLLRFTVEVLRIPHSPLVPSLEIAVQHELDKDKGKGSGPSQLEEWTDRLSKGLAKHPQNAGFLSVPKAGPNWAKWLFQVGKIGQLQQFLFHKTNIGVMGPTEAGKSELLTVLTGAPVKFFSSGFAKGRRTLEVQSYSSEEQTGVFHDCPGFDDQAESVRQMARLFQDIFDIFIIVIMCDSVRSAATENTIREIVHLLKSRRGPRPLRILLSKVDNIDFEDENPEEFTEAILDFKKAMVEKIRAGLGEDYKMISRRTVDGPSGISIVMDVEPLEDVVQLYSTHAQMSYKGKRLLCDCEAGRRPKMTDPGKHRLLYDLAEEGQIWDIVSLRQWLRGFSASILGGGSTRCFE